jgi:hypothetical protein
LAFPLLQFSFLALWLLAELSANTEKSGQENRRRFALRPRLAVECTPSRIRDFSIMGIPKLLGRMLRHCFFV